MAARVVVVDYDPEWPQIFRGLHDRIWPVVRDFAVAIEHVGSTAVPGLAAKPVIDLDIVTPSAAELPLAVERLAALGYAHQGNLGIEGREAFKAPPGPHRHNLYVCFQGSLGLRNHLALRDHLRTHPEAVEAYAGLKKRLAEEHPDSMDTYVEQKTDFIVAILEKMGLGQADRDRIERSNRAGR